jgi:WD40 repeat protein
LDNSIINESLNPSSLFTLKTHDKEVNSLTASSNDKQFPTGSPDKTAKVF